MIINYIELNNFYFSTKWRKVEKSGFFDFIFTEKFFQLQWLGLSGNSNVKLTTRVA